MRSRFVRLALALAALLAAAALTACGEETIDSADLEQSLAQQVAAKGVDPSDLPVTCPDDQKAEEGAVFTCTLTDLGGNESTIEVTLTDDEGGYDAAVVGKTPAGR